MACLSHKIWPHDTLRIFSILRLTFTWTVFRTVSKHTWKNVLCSEIRSCRCVDGWTFSDQKMLKLMHQFHKRNGFWQLPKLNWSLFDERNFCNIIHTLVYYIGNSVKHSSFGYKDESKSSLGSIKKQPMKMKKGDQNINIKYCKWHLRIQLNYYFQTEKKLF